jgi:hypothetical protein
LGEDELAAGWAFESGGDLRAGALVGPVGEDGEAVAFVDTDDAVGVSCGQVVGAARQRG